MLTNSTAAGENILYLVPKRFKTQAIQIAVTDFFGLESLTLSWYTSWLQLQFAKLPSEIFNILSNRDESGKKAPESCCWKSLVSVFTRVEECITMASSTTIDEVIVQLYDEGFLVSPPAADSEHHHQCARYLVFCMLGWQTMLFIPAFPDDSHNGNTQKHEEIPPSPPPLAIEEQDGCCIYTHMELQKDSDVCATESLSEFVRSFGMLLPSSNTILDEDPNIEQIFYHQTQVHAKTFNAYTLSAVVGLRIRWVDALACHLEFNSVTKEISLFRFPSFCQSMLSRSSSKECLRGAIHACATTSRIHGQWATEGEINQLLLEIILSYRLLFGQTKKSRSFFRSSFMSSNKRRKGGASKSNDISVDENIRDSILPELCGKETPCKSNVNNLIEKETYYLPRDFPILHYRISVLQRQLSISTPRTWMQLWRDKRDSSGWLTFWAVIVFGVFGSLMAFLQVLLQFIQMVKD